MVMSSRCRLYSSYYSDSITVEPPIKDTIEITSEQRTRFNVPNGDFPIVLTSDKGQPLNKGQNDQKKYVRYSEAPLYTLLGK